MTAQPPTPYGLMAEFATPEALLRAAERVREAGYERMDAYSPFPVNGLAETLGFRKNGVPFVVLMGGLAGGGLGYVMQWYASVVSYPLHVGGRPLHSWQSFIPITFELTILCAALGAFLAVLVLNRLPEPYHPVFNTPAFKRATQDRFFLCVEASDPHFDAQATARLLASCGPIAVHEVAP